MAAVVPFDTVTLPVLDDEGRTHERNPLGEGHACLACHLPFPCPTAAGGEQLHLEVDHG